MDPRRVMITGKAISVRGNDVDTDRIIPARYLKCVTFEGLGDHAFEDDRAQCRSRGDLHPFDNPNYRDAEILFVNRNFGCGSSREHAPQALKRWGKGIKAIVGESFAEIFFGNCVILGIPCVTADETVVQSLMQVNESAPDACFTLNLEAMTLSDGQQCFPVSLAEEVRKQFIEGHWDLTGELLAAKELIVSAASRLPYFSGWK